MNKEAITKHDIYLKLSEFTEQELFAIENFIDSMRHKKNLGGKKLIRLEGILKGQNIDLSDLESIRKEAWKHVDEESLNA